MNRLAKTRHHYMQKPDNQQGGDMPYVIDLHFLFYYIDHRL